MSVSPLSPGCGNLYLLCDGETCERHRMPPVDFIRSAADAGVKTFQYRHKNTSAAQYEENLLRLLPLVPQATLIVNDHAEIAARHQLPLHLGQDDNLPADLTVLYGRSTHSLAELEVALSCRPAPYYIALGTMFASATKPEVGTNRSLIADYRKRTQLPLVLIGGISLDNVIELPRADDIFYAVIGDAFRFGATSAGIKKYVESFALV